MKLALSRIALVTLTSLAALAAAGCGPEQPAQSPSGATTEGEKDIVDTAVAAGSFTTLAKALAAADLVDTLKGAGPFTVFAPTDDAFAALPAGTLEDLLKPENKAKLQEILKYHVVSGKVMAADVGGLKTAATVAGKDLKISVNGEVVMINESKVLKADVTAKNGVIHVIDKVMLPPG